MSQKAATIYDVARLAGVSHQTVTRFLRGSDQIRPETGQRVKRALEELDYRPNAAARMLRSRQTNRIGVLADRIDANGPARILSAASETAHRRGYVLDVVVADGTSPGSVSSSLAVLTEHQVAGILATVNTEVVIEEIRRAELRAPLTLAPEAAAHANQPSTSELAGALAADHLLALGHRRVGYIAGPEVWLASRDRLRGFRHRLTEAGAELVWHRYADWTPSSSFDIWAGLTEVEREITAVGAANDSMAIGIIAAAADMGLRVPDDLSVIGLDDIAESRYLRPSLTTVAIDFENEGRHAMEALIAIIEGADRAAVCEIVPPRLTARASTANI